MKKIPLLLLLALTMSLAKAQFITMPDTAFGSWMNANGYASCMTGSAATGWQLDTTCATLLAATNVDFQGDTFVTDISSIRYFKNLNLLWIRNDYKLVNIPDLPVTLTNLNLSLTGIIDVPANLPPQSP